MQNYSNPHQICMGKRFVVGARPEGGQCPAAPPPGDYHKGTLVTRVRGESMKTLAARFQLGREVRNAEEEACVVNAAFVRKYLPKQEPLGRRSSYKNPLPVGNG